jgi:hypothetical protein
MLLLEGSENFPEAEVYRDDLNDMHFYVLPQVPILRRDAGKAVFKFVKYRTLKPMPNGDVGAALVFMDVELALTPEQEQALRVKLAEKVKERRGAANPAPVDPNAIILGRPQISKATVTVEVLADSGNLVQKVNHAGKPSMYGNNVVAMSAELNQLGAPIFEAVMKSQGAGGVVSSTTSSSPLVCPRLKRPVPGMPANSIASCRRSTLRKTSGARTISARTSARCSSTLSRVSST